MMLATSLACPNCGGGLGPLEGGQYRCRYCNHCSLPPKPARDPAERAAALASLLGEFEVRRSRMLGVREELAQRERAAESATRRSNGFVMLAIGGLFLLFALACFAGTAVIAFSPAPVATHKGHAAPDNSPFGILAFGLFWLALGGGLFYIGVRYLRADRRDQRLRQQGLRGCAAVRSYRESNLVLDGNRKFDLVLEVEIPGRPPYVVRQSDYVPHPSAVTTGAELPVFVDPSRPEDLMIDWFAVS